MDKLIEQNMGLVVSVVNSFKPNSAEERDAYIQAGRIGLWKALKKYDPSKGAVLSTYAWNPIRWEIIKEIKSVKAGKYWPLSAAKTPQYSDNEEFWENCPDYLSDEECCLIELRRMGHTLAEICTICGRGRSYVKKTLYRAIQRIRESNE
jgi:DNA-directed RNA polymerase sigma subunit (sigma70/sigma32)